MSEVRNDFVTADSENPGKKFSRPPGDVLTYGFATTIAMWATGYFARLPEIATPSPVLFFLLLVWPVLGGAGFVRNTRNPLSGAAQCGSVAGTLNLLILGSLISRDTPTETLRAAVIWAPTSIAIAAALSFAGGAVAQALRWRSRTPTESPHSFSLVTIAATLLLLLVGGVVTGMEAGLAVVDWPNSFGYNMFLYPLARMTGGIYFEHAHRLLGSLVGLTTLALAVLLQREAPRFHMRLLGWTAFGMVCIQGMLGGLRVTGKFTLSALPEDTAPNLALAVVHGAFAQVFFGTLVAIAVLTSRSWRNAPTRRPCRSMHADRSLCICLVVLLLNQLVLGALLRHQNWGLHLHVTMALFVSAAAAFAGLRAWCLDDSVPVLPTLGARLIGVTGLQIALGVAALGGRMLSEKSGVPHILDVITTTAHQTAGALLLAVAVMLTMWRFHLFAPVDETTAQDARHAVSQKA